MTEDAREKTHFVREKSVVQIIPCLPGTRVVYAYEEDGSHEEILVGCLGIFRVEETLHYTGTGRTAGEPFQYREVLPCIPEEDDSGVVVYGPPCEHNYVGVLQPGEVFEGSSAQGRMLRKFPRAS